MWEDLFLACTMAAVLDASEIHGQNDVYSTSFSFHSFKTSIASCHSILKKPILSYPIPNHCPFLYVSDKRTKVES